MQGALIFYPQKFYTTKVSLFQIFLPQFSVEIDKNISPAKRSCYIYNNTTKARTVITLMNKHMHIKSYIFLRSQGCIQDFCQGGVNLEYVKKRGGGARLFVAAGQPQGGVGIQGGARIIQGG